jgi:hypothetical protein
MPDDMRLHLAEEGAGAEHIDALTGYLRRELLHLDVEVTALPGGDAPPGTRGLDVVAVGGLLVSLGNSAAGLGPVISAVRRWLARGGGNRRTVRIEIGGEVLELSEATAGEQDRLVRMFVSRHSTGEGGQWPVSAGP